MAVNLARHPELVDQAREKLGPELFEQIAEAIRLLVVVEEEPYLIDRQEAARRLGVSLSHFQRHVQPYLPCVYSGKLRLYRPADLEAWAEEQAVRPAERR
jgi:hypothetical protein